MEFWIGSVGVPLIVGAVGAGAGTWAERRRVKHDVVEVRRDVYARAMKVAIEARLLVIDLEDAGATSKWQRDADFFVERAARTHTRLADIYAEIELVATAKTRNLFDDFFKLFSLGIDDFGRKNDDLYKQLVKSFRKDLGKSYKGLK
ncbi:hypothetical protein ACFSYH_03365 [Populibacterium corticicola]|uniref:Uncharacterized protein n=1 Tax=Populibacterium corticicola TaxID=1812826 RepID=A0ABW5XEU2_9MICO